MSNDRRFTKSPKVVERKIRGEHILVPIAGTMDQLDSIYTLNATGSLIWEQAIGGSSEADIGKSLMDEFDVDAPTAKQDVTRILGELVAVGALEPLEK